MARFTLSSLALLALAAFPFTTQAQSNSSTKELPPKTWVDKDTGHRIWRISEEPNSGAFYFNINAYTPDHKQMVYNSPDGQTIWYDWQYPKGEDFFLASYNLQTGKRTAYHMQRNEWSIHFNLTQDLDLFTGDGGDPGQVAKAPDGEWIELFYPHMLPTGDGALNEPTFWQPGVFKSEHLVNMSHHNYRAEPNVRFSPDKKYIFFTSNMFGNSYIFGVEVAKAVNPPATDIQSTPELARKYNPVEPTATTTPK